VGPLAATTGHQIRRSARAVWGRWRSGHPRLEAGRSVHSRHGRQVREWCLTAGEREETVRVDERISGEPTQRKRRGSLAVGGQSMAGESTGSSSTATQSNSRSLSSSTATSVPDSIPNPHSRKSTSESPHLLITDPPPTRASPVNFSFSLLFPPLPIAPSTPHSDRPRPRRSPLPLKNAIVDSPSLYPPIKLYSLPYTRHISFDDRQDRNPRRT
jgi:hypothetical protein